MRSRKMRRCNDPSAAITSEPKCSSIALRAGVPGSTTARNNICINDVYSEVSERICNGTFTTANAAG